MQTPALEDAPPLPHDNLPTSVSSFLGRELAVADVHRLLDGRRLVTLTGSGGVGKTRLAVEVATAMRHAFAEGAWLVELGPLQDPALVPQAAAAALGVREAPGIPLAEHLTQALQPRQMLLVLDNCEHVLAEAAALGNRLLHACPGLRILATSREPLGIPGEVVWHVPSLSLPGGDGQEPTLEQVAASEAAQFFVERGGAVRPDFRLLPETATGIARVCRALDGIPLALELAAARLSSLTVEQLAERLSDRFQLLARGNPTAPSRHQTLRAALDWSYDLLSQRERLLLRRLAVFEKGWTLEAAEAIGSGDGIDRLEVVDLLTSLVNKSLVLLNVPGPEPRYLLLQTVHQYVQEKLGESGEAGATGGHHAAHFLTLAEQFEEQMIGPAQARWLQRLEDEYDNLRAALAWLLDRPDMAPAALRLATALGWFWYIRGRLSEGRRWLEQALAAGGDVALPVRARALVWTADLARAQGDLEAAEACAERAVACHRDLGQPADPWALTCLATVALSRGEVERPRRLLDESLTLFRRDGNRWAAGVVLQALGEVLRVQGDLDAGAIALEEALTLSRGVPDTRLEADVLQDLAHVARERGMGWRAAQAFGECLALARTIGDRRRLAEGLEGFAALAVESGHPERATRLLGAAQSLRDATGAKVEPADRDVHARGMALAREALGEALFATAWAAGHALPLEEAIALALTPDASVQPSGPLPDAPAPAVTEPLTARECEVAALVGRGFSNRQIAEALVITEGTAANHVKHILNKLDLHSRAQIAAWATAHGLLSRPPAEA